MIKLVDLIFEASDKDLFSSIKSELDSMGLVGKRDSKHGKHLRYNIGTTEETVSTINRVMSSLGLEDSDYDVEVIENSDFKKGAKSGAYKTYKITIKNSLEGFKSGSEVYIVNQQKEKSTIVSKSLSPTNLGLSGRSFKDAKSIMQSVKSNLKGDIADLLDSLMEDVYKGTSHKKGDSVDNFKDSISLSEKTMDSSSSISESDLNTIGKDFGEILGSIYLSKKLGGTTEFPSGNYPLVDFIVNGYKVSSKYKSGAAATLTEIIKGIDKKQLKKENLKKLYEVFEIAVNNNVSSGYLEVAKSLNLKGIKILSSIMNVSEDGLTTEKINAFISKQASNTDDVLKKLKPFYEAIGRSPDIKNLNWDKINPKKYYGLVIGPLSYHVIDYLNNEGSYKKALKEILSKVDVKQLYLNILLRKKILTFDIKSFSDDSSNFTFEAPNQSVYNPDNGRLGFKLK
jgi:hypothetical protein